MGDPPIHSPSVVSLRALDSHPFILHHMMQCRSCAQRPPSRCLDPIISVSPWRRVVVVKTLRVYAALTFALFSDRGVAPVL